jgi:hypothetical protein
VEHERNKKTETKKKKPKSTDSILQHEHSATRLCISCAAASSMELHKFIVAAGKKINSLTGNRTPVSTVTGWNTSHYTIKEDFIDCFIS